MMDQEKEQTHGQEDSPLRRIAMVAAKIVYAKPVADSLMQAVESAENPALGLAQAAMMVMREMQGKVKGLDPRVVFAVAPLVIGMIGELAAAAKLLEPSPEILSAALEAVKGELGGGQQEQPQATQGPQGQPPQGFVNAEMAMEA